MTAHPMASTRPTVARHSGLSQLRLAMQAMQEMLDHDSGPQHHDLRPARDLHGLAEALDRVARWVGQTIPQADLHGVALSVLSVLSTVGPQRMSQLAERERITQPGMTGVIHRLARAGLIERSAEPADGRIVLVTVTPQGRALLAERQAARMQALAEQLSRLPASEQDALCAAVDGLNALGTTQSRHRPVPRPHQVSPGSGTNASQGSSST
jgi:DNA-binding MarR family transcriptional regulator